MFAAGRLQTVFLSVQRLCSKLVCGLLHLGFHACFGTNPTVLPAREVHKGIESTAYLRYDPPFLVVRTKFLLGIQNMVVIRLSRGGAKGRPFFNLVVADKRNRRDGRFIERVGFYNPVAAGNEKGLSVNAERLAYWQQQGAQLSPTVARLVKQASKAAA